MTNYTLTATNRAYAVIAYTGADLFYNRRLPGGYGGFALSASSVTRRIDPASRSGFGMATSNALHLSYRPVLADAFRVASLLRRTLPLAVADELDLSDYLSLARGLALVEQIAFGSAGLPNVSWRIALAQSLAVNDQLRNFLGDGIVEGLRFSSQLLVNFRPAGNLHDTVSVNDLLANRLIIHTRLADEVELTAAQALQMMFQPTLSDGVVFDILHTDPSGAITTWAVNIRTGAITEYDNYEFNSFAGVDNARSYLAASQDGLFELIGARDEAQNIVTRMRSGMFAAGSQFTMFKNAYLGLRVRDTASEFFLKMIAGDGREYLYQFHPQNMMTTKVNFGKGLRSRYFSFELITTGADFDFDNIEFIPIVTQRRV